MKREEFVKSVKDLVQQYIDNFYEFDENPQIRVNPELLYVELENGYAFLDDIGYSDEVVENAAYAEGDATESSDDYQAKQDYEYYPVRAFLKKVGEHKAVPDEDAINGLADRYFKCPFYPNCTAKSAILLYLCVILDSQEYTDT